MKKIALLLTLGWMGNAFCQDIYLCSAHCGEGYQVPTRRQGLYATLVMGSASDAALAFKDLKSKCSKNKLFVGFATAVQRSGSSTGLSAVITDATQENSCIKLGEPSVAP